MKALAEIQVIPIGVGVSVRKEVKRAHELIRASGLKAQLHAYGTNVEGDLETILSTIKQVHETLHTEGTPRLSTNVKIGTRTDKEARLEEKLFDSGSS
ncbi:MAG: MTH1187 family thiamine-binding protein [Candidatus Latescibacterota bacterium]|nr:MAG: MTH1187 family thiamine-binding protein [Candidatus Latescibacterota bacterium]